jgi:hypothetical protein
MFDPQFCLPAPVVLACLAGLRVMPPFDRDIGCETEMAA